jgi:hypothetical protein
MKNGIINISKAILYIDLGIMILMNIFTIMSFFINVFLTLFFSDFYGYYFVITLLKCSIGTILFVTGIIMTKQKKLKRNYIFLIIPSIFSFIFLIFNMVNIFVKNYYEGGMTIPTLIMAFGGILWTMYWNLFDNNIVNNLLYKILLSINMPINLILLYIIIWGLIGF